MLSLNETMILGHLGTDAVMYKFPNGDLKLTLSVATDDGAKGSKRTNWHTIILYGDLAFLGSKLKKGDVVLVKGTLEYVDWVDEHNQKHIKAEIRAKELRIIQGNVCTDQQQPNRSQGHQQQPNRSQGHQQQPNRNQGQQHPNRNQGQQQQPNRNQGQQQQPNRNQGQQQQPNRNQGQQQLNSAQRSTYRGSEYDFNLS